MPSDYAAIRSENQQRYGTDIARIGPMLLADRYDDRTHFIYELLQNAEDALARRVDWSGSRAVQFYLEPNLLRLSHYGKPFDDRDVRGICGIAESTKERTAIGRFGIGFKSVYAYTTSPEVHSGDEDFAIESFVWPIAATDLSRGMDETLIVLPLNAGSPTSHAEIAKGLRKLGLGTLLFLREIEEIEWRVGEEASGVYLRSHPETLGSGVRRITVVGQEAGEDATEESWLIFFRKVSTEDGVVVGQVEIAFLVSDAEERAQWSIRSVANSPLVVFFPTVVETNLGFVVQGPYRTTPSRDNIPRNDPWNHRLVKETANLLVDALAWLRDNGYLDVAALRCLPVDRTKFPEASMFSPLFETVRTQLKSRRLLPTCTGTHVVASTARLARTQELRQLFSPWQLGALLGISGEVSWLSGDISQDRTPELRQYMMKELDIPELTPEIVLARLNKTFLEAQPDEWILNLYDFLQGQPALLRSSRINSLPIIRLTDGTHVPALEGGQPKAFLPSAIETAFPTVRKTVCSTEEARQCLETLGLTEPNPVDDVIWNILPKYQGDNVDVSDDAYRADIRRILEAFGTDSKTQREKLTIALRNTSFVMSVDAGNKSKYVSKPGELYFATARLKDLFDGVNNVLLVDDEYECLRGEEIRDLLEACGTSRSLQAVSAQPDFTWVQLRQLRIGAGCEDNSGGDRFNDYTLRGIDELLDILCVVDCHITSHKASLLWEALGDLQDRRGASVFTGTYLWNYYHPRSASFDASFVQELNTRAWIPDSQGELHKPCDLVFETLGWKANPLLLSKIRFKPPVIEMLAKEAGIEPGVLDLLRQLGVTSEADLRSRLGVEVEATLTGESVVPLDDDNETGQVSGGGKKQSTTPPETQNNSVNVRNEAYGSEGNHRNSDHGQSESSKSAAVGGRPDANIHRGTPSGARSQPANGGEDRVFISYIATHLADDEESDPDGLDQQARMALENKAIELILRLDPRLQRTATNNLGFDLFEPDGSGQPVRWVEVKAMTGELADRPVCLSRPQFDCAWVHGESYWLYIVEHAADDRRAVLLRIQDPAGTAKNFAFDRGWRLIAKFTEGDSEAGASPEGRG